MPVWPPSQGGDWMWCTRHASTSFPLWTEVMCKKLAVNWYLIQNRRGVKTATKRPVIWRSLSLPLTLYNGILLNVIKEKKASVVCLDGVFVCDRNPIILEHWAGIMLNSLHRKVWRFKCPQQNQQTAGCIKLLLSESAEEKFSSCCLKCSSFIQSYLKTSCIFSSYYHYEVM